MSQVRHNSVEEVLSEIDTFFMKTGPIHDTLRKLAVRLAKEHIDYAIIGGMALALHGFVRPAQDIYLLMTQEGLERFSKHMARRGYVPAFPGARRHFRDAETGVPIEVIVVGEYPGDGKPKSVSFPDPAGASIEMGEYRVIDVANLIELKLASGLSADD